MAGRSETFCWALEITRDAFRSHPWITFPDAPLTTPVKPLPQMKVALVDSGGLSLPGQTSFDEPNPLGDASFRWIPGPGPLAKWRIGHGHSDPAAALEDYKAIFPLDVLRGLAEEGDIGAVAPRHGSFTGYQPDPQPFLSRSVPEVASGFREDAVDAVLLVPV